MKVWEPREFAKLVQDFLDAVPGPDGNAKKLSLKFGAPLRTVEMWASVEQPAQLPGNRDLITDFIKRERG